MTDEQRTPFMAAYYAAVEDIADGKVGCVELEHETYTSAGNETISIRIMSADVALRAFSDDD